MEILTKKLFMTAIIVCLLELVTIICVGIYEIIFPTWGIVAIGVLAVVALLSLVLFFIRKYNVAD